MLLVIQISKVMGPGTGGNTWVRHAQYMFQQHGKHVTLLYEHPSSVGSVSLIPGLIRDTSLIVGSLQNLAKPPQREFLFSRIDF